MNDFQKYNPDQHHRRSIRLQDYDYSQEGLYFITICCYDKECLFGEIVNGNMVLNEAGKMANNEWKRTQEIRNNISLDEFVVMPNHIHGIISINCRGVSHIHKDQQNTDMCRGVLNTPKNIGNIPNFNINSNITKQEGVCNTPLQSPSQTIGAIVRGYKSSVTKQINTIRPGTNHQIWQRNYWEHVIRNEKSYDKIAEYIINNPAKWDEDSLNPIYYGMK